MDFGVTRVVSSDVAADVTVKVESLVGCTTAGLRSTSPIDRFWVLLVLVLSFLPRVTSAGRVTGNKICVTATTAAARSSARKKRFSIYGTGSYPPERKG